MWLEGGLIFGRDIPTQRQRLSAEPQPRSALRSTEIMVCDRKGYERILTVTPGGIPPGRAEPVGLPR
jgi:hypothetical protein